MQRRAIRLACFLLGLTPLILCRISGIKGSAVLPRRQAIARRSGWLGRWRRLSKDYEHLPEVSDARSTLAMVRLVVHRTT